ncbi:aryl-sulfate sulfotransferase [bacterium]|nr:aryl-sulfate sulfotransferase [bacterium]
MRSKFSMTRIQSILPFLLTIWLSGPQNGHGARTINGVAVPADFPEIITQVHGPTAPGRIFFSSTFFDTNSRSNYLVICENDGTPYFYRKYTRYYLGTGEFKVQPNGVLSFYKYLNDNEDGLFILMDRNFAETDTFRCAGYNRTDNHELVLLPDGHALLVAEEDRTVDMSGIVSGGSTHARVIGNHIQEVDRNGNLYWEWNCWQHLNIGDSRENLRSSSIDYIHLNSIAIDYDGHYIISFRNFSEVAKIDKNTGQFIWRLGGVNNEFTFTNENTMISYQHHARPVPDHPDHYTIFDNGNGRSPAYTRAVEYHIDPATRTAEKVWEYRYDEVYFTSMMGSVQRLGNGHTYIDWSAWPPLRSCEVDADNHPVFEMEVQGISSYRSFRFDWDGMMLKPDVLAESLPDGVHLIFNKFGDTDVAEYQVYGGKTPDAPDLMATTAETWADFTGLDNHTLYYFKVRAVNGNGQPGVFSDLVSMSVHYADPGANMITNGDFSSGQTGWDFLAREGAQASGLVSDGQYHVGITNGGTEYWHVQLIQESFPLVQGRTYTFEFDARADASRIIEPRVAENGGDYTVYSKTTPEGITTRMKHYAYEFTMTDPSDSRARVVLNCGTSDADCYFDNISVSEKSGTGISSNATEIPDRFILSQNYPNPFNTETRIRFTLPEPGRVTLTITDLSGREVTTLVDGIRNAGDYTVQWDGACQASGIYLYRLKTEKGGKTRKLILLK